MTTNIHKYHTRLQSGTLKRKIQSTNYNKNSDSDSDISDNSDFSDNDSVLDSDFIDDKDNNVSENNFNKLEYYKFLNKIFPSNYSKSKIIKTKRIRLQTMKDLLKNKNNIHNCNNKDYHHEEDDDYNYDDEDDD